MTALPDAYPTYWESLFHYPPFIIGVIVLVVAAVLFLFAYYTDIFPIAVIGFVCGLAAVVAVGGSFVMAPHDTLNNVVEDVATAKYHVTAIKMPTYANYTTGTVSGRTRTVSFNDCYVDLGATPADLVIQCPKAGTDELVDLNALTTESKLEDLGKGHG